MPTGPARAALWVLSRRPPVFDRAALATALGPAALVEGSESEMTVRLPGRSLRVLSREAPLSKELVDQCLPAAHLSPEQKQELATHAAQRDRACG